MIRIRVFFEGQIRTWLFLVGQFLLAGGLIRIRFFFFSNPGPGKTHPHPQP